MEQQPARSSRTSTVLLVVAHALLVALGLLLAIYGAFLVPRGPRAGGHVLSVGVAIALVGNALAGWLGGCAAGRLGGVSPFAGWLIGVLALSASRPSGSVVLPGSGDLEADVIAFNIVGALSGAVVAAAMTGRGVTGRRRRPSSSGPPGSR